MLEDRLRCFLATVLRHENYRTPSSGRCLQIDRQVEVAMDEQIGQNIAISTAVISAARERLGSWRKKKKHAMANRSATCLEVQQRS